MAAPAGDRRGDRRLRAVGARRRHRRRESADQGGEDCGAGYRITGQKVWVANAEEAAVAIVFACTRPGLRGQGVTAFLVPMDTPGITRTARADSLGVRGLGCMDLELDIAVTDDQVLGLVDQGFRLAMWALQGGRVAIAAQALGIGEAALDEAIAYAKAREQFGQPIANYQAIQWMLADMATELAAARMLTLKAAAAKDTQDAIALEASMAKLAASEAAHKAADKAMQILASAGYRRGSVVERLFRDVRATEIYQGTSEAQRMIIAASILPDVEPRSSLTGMRDFAISVDIAAPPSRVWSVMSDLERWHEWTTTVTSITRLAEGPSASVRVRGFVSRSYRAPTGRSPHWTRNGRSHRKRAHPG